MKKILFYLSRYPGIGGIENITSIIASKLQERGFDVSIVSHIHQDIEYKLNIPLFFMPLNKYYHRDNLNYVEELIITNSFNTVIYMDSYAPTENIICRLAKKHNFNLIVFERNTPLYIYKKLKLDPFLSIKGFLRTILHPYLFIQEVRRKQKLHKYCNKYMLLSSRFIPEFCKLTRIKDSSKIGYINNPSLLKPYNIDNKENVILFVGRLSKVKNVLSMLKLWAIISQQLTNWRFEIVGDGEERESLEKYVNDNNIQNVIFCGFDNPLEYYQRAKIFWLQSEFEGWANTLVEAMSCGCIPVAFDTYSSIYDIIDSGTNGYLIANQNQEIFSEKTLELATVYDRWAEMSNNAIIKSNKFQLDNIIEEWIKII